MSRSQVASFVPISNLPTAGFMLSHYSQSLHSRKNIILRREGIEPNEKKTYFDSLFIKRLVILILTQKAFIKFQKSICFHYLSKVDIVLTTNIVRCTLSVIVWLQSKIYLWLQSVFYAYKLACRLDETNSLTVIQNRTTAEHSCKQKTSICVSAHILA